MVIAARILAILIGVLLFASQILASEFNRPWRDKNRALVLDAFELNPIDWNQIGRNKRIVGFISKASDGLPPVYDCWPGKTELLHKLCREQFRKYAITKELYKSRKLIAKQQGIKWGAYHLGRPGNPIDQANHFIKFAEPGPDDLIALDIEGIDAEKWISLKDAEIFARHIKTRLGRYPLLYVNGNTAKFIARNANDYPVLSRLGLWYARYKPNIKGVFPMGNWKSYAIWQFSHGGNCNKRRCPYRVKGARDNIDVNVTQYSIQGLKKAWPLTMNTLPGSPKLPKNEQVLTSAVSGHIELFDAVDQMITGSIAVGSGRPPPGTRFVQYPTAYAGRQNNFIACDQYAAAVEFRPSPHSGHITDAPDIDLAGCLRSQP